LVFLDRNNYTYFNIYCS